MNKSTKISLVALLALVLILSAAMLVACGLFSQSTEPKLNVDVNRDVAVDKDTPLENLKQYLTVRYTDGSGTVSTVTDYALSGALSARDSKLTVSYNGLTATCYIRVAIQYKITFTTDDGVVATVFYTEGDKSVNEPQVPEKKGYSGKWEDYVLDMGDIVVRAIYTVTSFSVSLDYDGATGSNSIQQISVTYGSAVGNLPVPTKDGYTFDGWYDEDTKITSSTLWAENMGDTLTAKWTAVSYPVRFLADNRIVATLYYTVDDTTVTEPDVPNKTGYDGAWPEYTLTSGEVRVNAVYTPKQYEITLDYSGATGNNDVATISVTYNSAIGDGLPTPAKTGNQFIGWYMDDVSVSQSYVWTVASDATFVAEWTTEGLIFTQVNNPNTAFLSRGDYVVSKGEATATDVVIPSRYFGKPVKGIDDLGFKDYAELHSIVIPDSVAVIGGKAFYNCSDLVNVSLGNGIVEFFTDAFALCDNLQYNEYGNGLYLGNEDNPYVALMKGVNDEITSLVIHDDARTVYEYAFSNGYNDLTTLTISKNLISINDCAFNDCANLETVVWNAKACVNFDSWRLVFDNCPKLTSVTFGSEVTEFNAMVFGGCENLYVFTVSDENEKFEVVNGSIIDKTTKTLVLGGRNSVIPSDGSVTSIAQNAFYGRLGLKSIEIPATITSIESYAFRHCYDLMTVRILAQDGEAANRLTIKDSAFANSYRLVEIYNESGLTLTKNATQNGYIAYYAFNIYTPASGSSNLSEYDGYFIYSDGDSTDVLVNYVGTETELDIPESFGGANFVLHDYAFYKRCAITSVVVPECIEEIPELAFSNCTSLASVKLLAVSAIASIKTFENCPIESIACSAAVLPRIPKTVLTTVEINGGTQVKRGNMSGCDNVTTLTVYEGITHIEKDAFGVLKNLKTVYWNATSLAEGSDRDHSLFPENSVIDLLEVGENVETMTAYMFNGSEIKTVIWKAADYVFSLVGTDHVFWNAALTMITFTDNVTVVPKVCYKNQSVSIVNFGNGVQTISSGAFDGCSNLEEVTLGKNVTNIETQAFVRCANLASVTIPSGVTNIGVEAFSNCTSLTEINFLGTAEQWAAVTKERNWHYDVPATKVICAGGVEADLDATAE
ncbi:MAG: leucine-rich repeat protein [Firmicutes bacterium]|nr:leucine-rich repeat protein [Bacillota bacterium]